MGFKASLGLTSEYQATLGFNMRANLKNNTKQQQQQLLIGMSELRMLNLESTLQMEGFE